MLASYIVKHHWLAHLQDAWIVERTGGRRRGHCVQVRDTSLLALSPYLVPFGLTVDAGALCLLVCARLSAAWVDEAMRFIVRTNLNRMIRLSRRLWYKFFVLQTYLSHDFRFFYCNVKEIWYSLSWSPFAKRKIPMAWFTLMVHSEGDTEPTMPAL